MTKLVLLVHSQMCAFYFVASTVRKICTKPFNKSTNNSTKFTFIHKYKHHSTVFVKFDVLKSSHSSSS